MAPNHVSLNDAFLRLSELIGSTNVIRANDSRSDDYLREERGEFSSEPAFIITPETTQQVSLAVKLSREYRIPLVPQAGNTGLCGGAVAEPDNILLSVRNLNVIRELDPLNNTMTAESGCILSNIQNAAQTADRFFPLSLGAEGSCMIGGNLSTNAGGINVLRYGNTRQQLLGLEVVLPDGQIWHGLNSLIKNNTGYDLKQLFVGAEGTLGVVTAAQLRLYPRPIKSISCWLGIDNLDHGLHLLSLAKRVSGDQLSSFELIPDFSVQLAIKHTSGIRRPLEKPSEWNLLVQFSTSSAFIPLTEITEAFVEEGMNAGWIQDGVVTQSEKQEAELWRIREAMVPAQKQEGLSIKHDVSVPIAKIPELVRRVNSEIQSIVPGIRPYPFGHMGDGNLHFNMLQPVAQSQADFYLTRSRVNESVYRIVNDLGGSFSAEHGIGKIKIDHMSQFKQPLELELMHRIKQAFDPDDQLNPGKVLPARE
ncbi:MAG: FAD/FMN-containing dehydrogenase [Parasphingorhabdus sp.]|jgi:FAD/FMN-containing dehydrogenase